MLKIWNELHSGFIYKKFDEFQTRYEKIITFKKDNSFLLASKEEGKSSTNPNIEYDKDLDIYYIPFSCSGFKMLVNPDLPKHNLKEDYLDLKELYIIYKGKTTRYLMPVVNDVYVLNNNGDTIQKM